MAFVVQKDLGYDSGESDHFLESYTVPSTGNVQNKIGYTFTGPGNILVNSAKDPEYEGAIDLDTLTGFFGTPADGDPSSTDYDLSAALVYNKKLYVNGRYVSWLTYYDGGSYNSRGVIQSWSLFDDEYTTSETGTISAQRWVAPISAYPRVAANLDGASTQFGGQFAIAHNRLFATTNNDYALVCYDLATWGAGVPGGVGVISGYPDVQQQSGVLWIKDNFLYEYDPYPTKDYSNIESLAAGDGRVVVSSRFYGNRTHPNISPLGIGGFAILNLDGFLLRKIEHEDRDVSGTGFEVPDTGVLGNSRMGRKCAVGCNRIVVGLEIFDSYTATESTPKAYIFDLNGNYISYINSYSPHGTLESSADPGIAIGNNFIAVSFPTTKKTRDYDPLEGEPENSGIVQLYDMNGNYIKTFSAPSESNSGYNNRAFGNFVAISNNRLIIADNQFDTGNDPFGNSDNRGRLYTYDLYTGQQLSVETGENNDDYFGSNCNGSGDGILITNHRVADYTSVGLKWHRFPEGQVDAVTDLLNKY
jgi:hypothetical protein